MVAAGDSTEAAVAADFMEGEAGFTAEEVLVEEAEATLVLAAGIHLAGIVVAGIAAADITVAAATTVAMAVMDGADEVMAGAVEAGVITGTVTDGEVGAGDLDLGGRIGDMAGDIRTATTATAGGITRPTLMVTRPTGLQTT